MKGYEEILQQLDIKLEMLETENEDVLCLAERGIEISKRTLIELRTIVNHKNFVNTHKEIHFFKHIKPKVFSKLIYYVKLFNIESRRPRGRNKSQVKYFNNQIVKLQTYFNENIEFYQYYRRGATYLDKHYFIRGKSNIRLHPETFHFFSDEQFSTSHDSTVANVMAYDLLIIYLKREIDKLENNDNGLDFHHLQKQSRITWTSQKVNLIELIYALHNTDVINNGNVDIKDIARVAERIFKIDLGDYYRAFLEIRLRKKGRTKFLDLLKENLEKRMDEIDD